MARYDIYGNVSVSSGKLITSNNYRINATYFGHDFENRILGDNLFIPMSKYPCKSFQDASITVIAPKYGNGSKPLSPAITLLGQRVIGNVTSIYVGDIEYWLVNYLINIDTTETPETASGDWKLYIPFGRSEIYDWNNENVWFVADVPLDEITEKFILDNGKVTRVSDDFKTALSLVGVGSGSAAANVSSLRGKVWIAFGDSYTRYLAGLGDPDSAKVLGDANSQWGKLSTQLGTTMYTYGIVGSTIRDGVNTNSTEFWKPMAKRVDSIIANHASEADDVGLITFMGGTNDGWKDEKVGTLMSTSTGTIAGGCHKIFNKLSKAFPKAKIIVILQPANPNATNPGTDVDGRDTSGFDDMQFAILALQKKQRVVKEVAEFYGCTICDCIFDWFTPANPTHEALVWDSSDHLHLTAYGNQMLTEKLVKTINSVFV